MNQNEIINTVGRSQPRDYFITEDGRFGIGMTAAGIILVSNARSTQAGTLGRFRTRIELYKFLKRNQPAQAEAELPVLSERERSEVAIYGCTEEKLLRWASTYNLRDPFDCVHYAIAILSDSQEEMRRGDMEAARKYINRAKFFMHRGCKILKGVE